VDNGSLDSVGINACKLDSSLDSEVQPIAPPMAPLTLMAQLLTTWEDCFTLIAQRMVWKMAHLTRTKASSTAHCVGKDNLLDNVRNGADGRRTDTSDQKPVKNTYADITRKGVQRKPLESVRKALLSLSRINPIVRTV
jgi:hypothetical protein